MAVTKGLDGKVMHFLGSGGGAGGLLVSADMDGAGGGFSGLGWDWMDKERKIPSIVIGFRGINFLLDLISSSIQVFGAG